MEAVMLLAAVPLMILNMLGGLVGGIGLAIQGHWSLVIGGIAWLVIGGFALSIALLPGMIFAPLAMWAANRGNTTAAIVAAVPSLLWTYAVVTVTSIIVFLAAVACPESGFFHLLWGYSVTTGPWSFLANKDKQSGNDASTMLMFFVQLGVVSMMFASWSDPESMTAADLIPWFVPFMALGLIAQVFVAVVEDAMRATVATDVRPPIWLSLAVAAACLVALADWPYGFYQSLRLVVTGYAVWIAFQSAAHSRPVWPWVFGIVAVLYNPFFKISMSRDVHAVENVFTAIAIVVETIRAKQGNTTGSR